MRRPQQSVSLVQLLFLTVRYRIRSIPGVNMLGKSIVTRGGTLALLSRKSPSTFKFLSLCIYLSGDYSSAIPRICTSSGDFRVQTSSTVDRGIFSLNRIPPHVMFILEHKSS